MKFRITVLCENSVGPIAGTLGEHGFSALVESEGESVLFDTGQGETLLHNAQRMKKDLCQVRKVAISHGHYDHTGGLRPLLQSCGGKEIFAHPGIFARRYRVKDTGESIPIGIPFTEELLRNLGGEFTFSEGFREIAPDIFLTGEVPRSTEFERGDAGLFCDDNGCATDPVLDDQSVIIRAGKGLVLLLGCCHAGIINTIELARERTGMDTVYAVMGGAHLGFCSREQLEETIRCLRGYRVQKILGSHCTGFAASARLLREFPGAFHPAHVGYTLEL